jgi:hypothetical protein
MARPRKNSSVASLNASPDLGSWAEALGEALGRGIAGGINSSLSALSGLSSGAAPAKGARRPGRPAKAKSGASGDHLCKIPGCGRDARSKGLCSAHYQAERRKHLAKTA